MSKPKQAFVEPLTFTGTTETISILNRNPNRTYLAFYASSGACTIGIEGSATPFILAEGTLWEPLVTFTNGFTFTGNTSVLLVMTSGDRQLGLPLGYGGYELYYGATDSLLSYT